MRFNLRVILSSLDAKDYPDQQRCKYAICPCESTLRRVTSRNWNSWIYDVMPLSDCSGLDEFVGYETQPLDRNP